MRKYLFALLLATYAWGATVFVAAVSQAATNHDFKLAQALLNQYRGQRGVTAEYLEADSWIGRGELSAKNYEAALQNAAEVRQQCVKQLTSRKLDAESSLPTALGATIEVTAQATA